MAIIIKVIKEDFDVAAEFSALRANNPKIGALASFVGLVRDVNESVVVHQLELEHYPGMTERVLNLICSEAQQRWDLLDCLVIHRFGVLQPTDQIVLVATTSAHRADAFAACQYIMDYLKTAAPFWKKETTPQGTRWVEPRQSDQQAQQKWGER